MRSARTRAFMQALRLFLLVILSLGMQVPGGLRLELCLCQGLAGLFHSHAPQPQARSCCDADVLAAVAGADAAEHGGVRLTRERPDGDCCGCIELHTLPQPTSVRPQPGPTIDLPARPALEFVAPAEAPVVRIPPGSDRAHDPPWASVSLPLRI